MPTESNKKHNRASRTRNAINQPENKTILLLQKCNNCEVDLSTTSKYTICERCGGYVCLKCLGWSEETYDVLNKEKFTGISIICCSCKNFPNKSPDIVKMLNEIKTNQERSEKNMDNKLKGMKSSLTNMEGRLTGVIRRTIKLEIEAQLQERISGEFVQLKDRIEVLEEQISDKDSMRDEIVKLVHKEISERKNVESRKPNLIIYNVPESGPDVSINDKQKHDERIIKQILDETVGVDESENIRIIKIIRLRAKENEIKPTKVICDSVYNKFRILKNAKNLGKCGNSILQNIRIVPDRTKEERANYAELKKQINERNEPGLVIRRGQIVKLDKPVKLVTSQTNKNEVNIDNQANSQEHHDKIGIETQPNSQGNCREQEAMITPLSLPEIDLPSRGAHSLYPSVLVSDPFLSGVGQLIDPLSGSESGSIVFSENDLSQITELSQKNDFFIDKGNTLAYSIGAQVDFVDSSDHLEVGQVDFKDTPDYIGGGSTPSTPLNS